MYFKNLVVKDELFANLYEYTYALCDVVGRNRFQNEIQINDEYCGAFEILKNILSFCDFEWREID